MLHTPRSSIDRVAYVHVIALIIPEIPLANTWPPPRNICKSPPLKFHQMPPLSTPRAKPLQYTDSSIDKQTKFTRTLALCAWDLPWICIWNIIIILTFLWLRYGGTGFLINCLHPMLSLHGESKLKINAPINSCNKLCDSSALVLPLPAPFLPLPLSFSLVIIAVFMTNFWVRPKEDTYNWVQCWQFNFFCCQRHKHNEGTATPPHQAFWPSPSQLRWLLVFCIWYFVFCILYFADSRTMATGKTHWGYSAHRIEQTMTRQEPNHNCSGSRNNRARAGAGYRLGAK